MIDNQILMFSVVMSFSTSSYHLFLGLEETVGEAGRVNVAETDGVGDVISATGYSCSTSLYRPGFVF